MVGIHTVVFVLALSLQHFEYAESNYSTTLFDVSASIQGTLDVFSFDPTTQHLQQEPTTQQSSFSSMFSLSLHPRSSLIKPLHNNYTALTLSRLERDSARVNSIAATLNPQELETPVTSGAGEYLLRVGVGQPPKQYYMLIDTGSNVNWLKCEPCTSCEQQSDPIFDPSGSSTYSPLACNSPQCNALGLSNCTTAGLCRYEQSYLDGSFANGDFATETLTFANSVLANRVAIGCGHDEKGFDEVAGVIGLGSGSLSLPSQIKATSFSYCLVDRNSQQSSTLDFNSVRPDDSITAPLIRKRGFYYIGLTGISVGGQQLSIPPSVFQIDVSGRGGVVIDSGATMTYLKTEAYNSLRDAFVRMAPNLPWTSGFQSFDTCYDLWSMRRNQNITVPTVSFQFAGGKTLWLGSNNYLIPVDSGGKMCLAFSPASSSSFSIIGNILQQHIRVTYDLANSVIGFSPNKC